jgi:hypothetical protein
MGPDFFLKPYWIYCHLLLSTTLHCQSTILRPGEEGGNYWGFQLSGKKETLSLLFTKPK